MGIKDYILKVSGYSPSTASFLKAQGIDNNVIESSDNSMLSQIQHKHSERLKLYNTYLQFYFGNQSNLFVDYDTTAPFPKVFRIAPIVVNKHASYLMNKGFLVESDFYEIQKNLQYVWKNNLGGEKDNNKFGYNAAIMGGITGDVFTYIYVDSNTKDIKIDLLNSNDCYPVLDDDKMIGLLYYKNKNKIVEENYGISTQDEITSGYYINSNKVYYIENDKVINQVSYDFPLLPLFHIQNFPNPFSFYGISDLANLIDINIAIDKLLTNISDIIDYHSSPVTIVTGAKASDLVRGVNRVWFINNPDASVSNLSLEGDLIAANNYLQKLFEYLYLYANINENSFGKTGGISNTPASGLAITFMPLYEYMEVKRLMYGSEILRMNEAIIKMMIIKGDLDINKIIKDALNKWEREFSVYSDDIKEKYYPFRKKIKQDYEFTLKDLLTNNIPSEIFETYITWYPPLNRDFKLDVDTAIANVNAGLWSKRHARSFIGMNEKESLLMEKEIQDELSKSENPTIVTNKQPKTGMEGNPDVKGEKTALNLNK